MEVSTGKTVNFLWRRAFLLLLCLATHIIVQAQPATQKCSIQDGKMVIELGKQVTEEALDSFIVNFDLFDLDLKNSLRLNVFDTLQKLGWKLEKNNQEKLIISKTIGGFDRFDNAADKIIFTENTSPELLSLGSIPGDVKFGVNYFKETPASLLDSLVTLQLPNHQRAKRVMLAGNFNNWDPDAMPMQKTETGWITRLHLKPGKFWYKFVVVGNWITDPNNKRIENDGSGNNNSVLYKANHLFTLQGFEDARRVYVAGSFNDWEPRQLQLIKTAAGWQLPIYLSAGTHTYRFVVNGKWMADPANPNQLPNEFGEFNSVVSLGKPYRFLLPGYPNAQQVTLAGSFNKWRYDELYLQKTPEGWLLDYSLGPGLYAYRYRVDGRWLDATEKTTPEKATASNEVLVIGANHTFRVKGLGTAKSVFLAGDFNDWAPDLYPMHKEGNEWVLPVHLSPGKHTYKLVVDGKWIIDPGNDLWEQNEFNTGNSVIWFDPLL